MRLLTKMLRQKVVYWSYAGVDNFGKPKYNAPIEIKARWEDVVEQYLRADLVEATSLAKVYVDRDLTVKGVLWLSTKKASDAAGSAIAELTDQVKPFNNPRAAAIQRFDKLPDLKVKNFLRTAYL